MTIKFHGGIMDGCTEIVDGDWLGVRTVAIVDRDSKFRQVYERSGDSELHVRDFRVTAKREIEPGETIRIVRLPESFFPNQ